MRRRFRRSASGKFPADALSPLFRTVAFLIVLGLIYSSARNPQSWRWLESNSEATPSPGERGTRATGADGQRCSRKSVPRRDHRAWPD